MAIEIINGEKNLLHPATYDCFKSTNTEVCQDVDKALCTMLS